MLLESLETLLKFALRDREGFQIHGWLVQSIALGNHFAGTHSNTRINQIEPHIHKLFVGIARAEKQSVVLCQHSCNWQMVVDSCSALLVHHWEAPGKNLLE